MGPKDRRKLHERKLRGEVKQAVAAYVFEHWFDEEDPVIVP
jgi:hypothetical protein